MIMNRDVERSVLEITKMLKSRIPSKAVEFDLISGSRGNLGLIGFAKSWRFFLDGTSAEEISVSTNDLIGGFDATNYWRHIQQFHASNLRSVSCVKPLVIFFQMPQGPGKSTLGRALCNQLNSRGIQSEIVEQY